MSDRDDDLDGPHEHEQERAPHAGDPPRRRVLDMKQLRKSVPTDTPLAAKVVRAGMKDRSDGRPQLWIALRVSMGDYAGNEVVASNTLDDQYGQARVRSLLSATGLIDVDEVDPAALVGKMIIITLLADKNGRGFYSFTDAKAYAPATAAEPK